MPMEWSFSSMRVSILRRMGSVGGRDVRAWASWRREPQIPGGRSVSGLEGCFGESGGGEKGGGL